VLSVYRFVVGLLFACHGLSSLFGILGGTDGHGATISPTSWPGGYAALIQLVAGLLVMIGLGTRLLSLIASGSMAYAYFHVHQPNAWLPIQNHGEPAAMFCWAFLLLVFTGGGAIAVDRLVSQRRIRRSPGASGAVPIPAAPV
jgi:putative oxidoreductase